MIELYDFGPSPTCRAVKMVARLIGVELRSIPVDYFKKEHHSESYRKMNPFHSLPVINDNGLILYESRAITTYLVNKYKPDSPLYPRDPAKRALVDQMLHMDNGTLFPTADLILLPKILESKEPSEQALEKIKDVLENLETVLTARAYIAGDVLSLADISVSTSLTLLEMAVHDLSPYPNLRNYIQKITKELHPMYEEINNEPVQEIKKAVEEIMSKK